MMETNRNDINVKMLNVLCMMFVLDMGQSTFYQFIAFIPIIRHQPVWHLFQDEVAENQ